MMRSLLDKLYLSSGILSGICMISICVIILIRVIGRFLGIEIPSSDDFAGFLLAASSFFGLAYTFHHGAHIRVNLFTSKLSASMNRYVNSIVLVLGSILVTYLFCHLTYMVYESYLFEELSSGYIAVPLWLVQLPLAIGMLFLTIAFIDHTIATVFYGAEMSKSEEEALVEAMSNELSETQEIEPTHSKPMGNKS